MLADRRRDLLLLCKERGVWKRYADTGAHYLLQRKRDGLIHHTEEIFEFAAGFQYADFREIIAREFMEEFAKNNLMHAIDVIITPAMGGVLLGATIQHFFYGSKKPRIIYTEKGKLHRGFCVENNESVLKLDDVTTTGGSFEEMDAVCQEGLVVGQAAILNRSPRRIIREVITVPEIYLLELPLSSMPANSCYLCDAGVPLLKDGVQIDRYGNQIST